MNAYTVIMYCISSHSSTMSACDKRKVGQKAILPKCNSEFYIMTEHLTTKYEHLSKN